eukprot:3493034-Alexandrium_andersonii.AAC.1
MQATALQYGNGNSNSRESGVHNRPAGPALGPETGPKTLTLHLTRKLRAVHGPWARAPALLGQVQGYR